MKTRITTIVAATIALSFSVQNAWSEEATEDCSTAEDDISTLQHEKKKTSDKAVDGVLAFTPIGLVANVATGGDQMDQEQKMDAEEYNKHLDARIAEIKKACGLD